MSLYNIDEAPKSFDNIAAAIECYECQYDCQLAVVKSSAELNT